MKINNTILYKYAKVLQEQKEKMRRFSQADIPEGVTSYLGVKYAGDDGNPLTMDVFSPVRDPLDDRLFPVIIMIHGGGLFMGEPRMEAGACVQFAMRGFLVFSLSYRLLTEADACGEMADICAGLRQVANDLDKYGGSRDRVFVVGESAGAFLGVYAVALHRSRLLWEKVGCRLSNLTIRKMAFFSGMFYTNNADLIGVVYPRQIYGERQSDKEFMEMMNPEHPEIIRNMPPMLLVSSEDDFLREYTLQYEKALKNEKMPCRLCYYTGNKELTHAFPSLKPYLKESGEVMDQVSDLFLEAAVY